MQQNTTHQVPGVKFMYASSAMYPRQARDNRALLSKLQVHEVFSMCSRGLAIASKALAQNSCVGRSQQSESARHVVLCAIWVRCWGEKETAGAVGIP